MHTSDLFKLSLAGDKEGVRADCSETMSETLKVADVNANSEPF